MVSFLIATHGKLAEGLYDTLTMVAGRREDVSYFCAYTEGENDLEGWVKEYMGRTGEGGTRVVLTDILGGSVNNEFMKWLGTEQFYLISGVSLPLLLELLMSSEPDIDKRIKEAIRKADTFVCECTSLMLDHAETDNF